MSRLVFRITGVGKMSCKRVALTDNYTYITQHEHHVLCLSTTYKVWYPTIAHTTFASSLSKLSSQTVPHSPSCLTLMVPDPALPPPDRNILAPETWYYLIIT